jgi:YggT family protein
MPFHGAGFSGRVMLAVAIDWAATALIWLIIIDAVLTFIPSIDRRHPLVVLLRSITEPIYRPIRKLIPPVRTGDAAWDLSPLIAVIGIGIIVRFIVKLLPA